MAPILSRSMMTKRAGILFYIFYFLLWIVCCFLFDCCFCRSQFASLNSSSTSISTLLSAGCGYSAIKSMTIHYSRSKYIHQRHSMNCCTIAKQGDSIHFRIHFEVNQILGQSTLVAVFQQIICKKLTCWGTI